MNEHEAEGADELIPAERLAVYFGLGVATVAPQARWLTVAARKFGVLQTPETLAAFLGQVSQETARLRYMREIWDPNTCHWQKRYERAPGAPWSRVGANAMAYTLGNENQGDGYVFRGGGDLQLTGRHNYTKCGQALGISAEDLAEMIDRPGPAVMSAVWYWAERKIDEPAQDGDIDEVTRRINPGMLHHDRRLAYTRAATNLLA